MRVALTGGTGFVGRHVLDRLLARGHEVQALARRPQPPRDDVTWVAGSLSDAPALAALVEGTDAVIHVAGLTTAPDRAAFDAGNVAGTRGVVDAARAAGVARFVHVSSLSVREPLLSAYGASKLAAEAVVDASGLDWTIVRPAIIYGEGELLDLFKMAARGFVLLPPGKGRASVIAVEDLARLLVLLAEKPEGSCAIYECDDGRPGGWAHAEFARALGAAAGREILPLPLPRFVMSIAAKVDGTLRGPKAQLTPDRVAYFCHPDWVADPARHPSRGFWQAEIATSDGLAATAAKYRAAGAL